MYRKHLSHKKSNHKFKHGMRTHKKNLTPAPSRGGYRL
jgi:hypothetical protein